MEKLDLTKDEYNFVYENFVFNKKKQEQKIFQMLYEGYNNCDIAKEIKCSEATIRNRKKEILKAINFFLNENEIIKNTYQVYIHKFPNNKVYVGLTKNYEERWKNGKGYIHNTIMYDDILYYGWKNIEHIIIESNLSYEQAKIIENNKIKEYESYMKDKGYNTTYIKGENK